MANGLTSGRGVAFCRVTPDGSLTQCQALAAEPDGFGFSAASGSRLAASFKMSSWTNGDGPLDGATINLPLRFDRASGTSAPRPGGESYGQPIEPFNVRAAPKP